MQLLTLGVVTADGQSPTMAKHGVPCDCYTHCAAVFVYCVLKGNQ